MVLQQLETTGRQKHADAQATSQAGAVSSNRYKDMIAIVWLLTFELAPLAECLMWQTHGTKRNEKRQQYQGI